MRRRRRSERKARPTAGLQPFEERRFARREKARRHLERMRRRGGVVASNAPRRSSGLRRRVLTLLFAIAVGLGSFYAARSSEPRRSLRDIAVQGHQRLTARDVAEATRLERGRPLSSIDAREVAAQLEAHPWIRRAQAVALASGELVVRIEEREPHAVVRWREGDTPRRALVDRDGTPFAQPGEEHAALPRLVAPGSLPADAPQPLLAEGLSLTALLPSALRGRAVEWRVPPPGSRAGWILAATDPPQLTVVLGHDELPRRLARLGALLSSDREAIRRAREIDLRFADQAVLRELHADTAEMASGSG